MAPGLGDGRGCEGLAPLYPYWEGSAQYLESDLLCGGVGMVRSRPHSTLGAARIECEVE